VKPKSIDPSFGICYYLRDFEELNSFYEQMKQCRSDHENEFFIWMNETTPHYLNKSVHLSKVIELEEDYYEPL
jgi:hypothetical protein